MSSHTLLVLAAVVAVCWGGPEISPSPSVLQLDITPEEAARWLASLPFNKPALAPRIEVRPLVRWDSPQFREADAGPTRGHYWRDGHEIQNTGDYVEEVYRAAQYHGQDGLGAYAYGYETPESAKVENRERSGRVDGSYVFLNDAGPGGQIEVRYWADHDGFHQEDNLPKEQPQPVQETEEVRQARLEHERAWRQAADAALHPNAQSQYSTSNQQYTASATGSQYAALASNQQYTASPPGPQYTASASNQQFAASAPGPQYTASPSNHQFAASAPGPQYTASASNQQFAASAPGPQYTASASNQQFAASVSNPQYAASAPSPQYAAPSSDLQHEASAPGPQHQSGAGAARDPKALYGQQQGPTPAPDVEQEPTGPPRGFFYSYDYPVSIIRSKSEEATADRAHG